MDGEIQVQIIKRILFEIIKDIIRIIPFHKIYRIIPVTPVWYRTWKREKIIIYLINNLFKLIFQIFFFQILVTGENDGGKKGTDEE